MTDLEQLARGLSEAQRKWLLLGRAPGGNGKWPVHNALIAKGLATAYPWRWTELGTKLAAHLRSQGGA